MRRRSRIARAVLPLALGVLVVGAGMSTTLDYVTFDRIDYIQWADEPGRALTRADLGMEFATVGCSIGEDVRGCPYGIDAGAAFIPAGTRMYAVRGYATEFRLAAVWRDHIYLYQAWRNPRARLGGALFDIAGKVRSVEVRRGEPTAEASGKPAVIATREDVDALVGMIVRGPTRPPRAHRAGEPRYWLTFWLTDGTTLGRSYFPETSELLGGVVVAGELRALLDRYLAR